MQKRKAFFTSISKKLMLLNIIGAFTLAVTLVAVAIALSSKILSEGASAQMNLFCEERADDINLEMARIEDAVSSLARWTRSRIPDVETIKEDGELRDAIVDDADDLIRFMTEHNEGVYYTRNDDGNFKTIPFTQEEIVNDPVAEDWYYGPIRLGEPAWTKPYYDYSVENYIVSYIEPVFIGDTPVAVIGIDISFTRVIDWVDTFSYQESGYMFLKEADGTVHYHYDDLVNGHMHGDEIDHVQENGDLMNEPATGTELVRYYFEGSDRAMAFVTLRNGMKLVLCDDYANIYNERDNAVVLMIILSVFITMLIAIVAVVMVNRITDPLRKITEAARAVSENNFDVDLPPENDDEIGELSKMTRLAIENARARAEKAASKVREQERKIEKSAKVLKQQGDDLVAMKNLAYVDSLTNVKNKLAYDDTVEYINEKIRSGTAEFAVIMCDLNYLKHINDNLGHIAGDEAIQKTASILCKAFPLSTVFRIGGDEFAVLPTGLDYARIDEKLDALKTMLESQRNISDNYLERISLAFGYAVFERGKDTTYQEVFERADKIMYEEKKKIHVKDGILTDR